MLKGNNEQVEGAFEGWESAGSGEGPFGGSDIGVCCDGGDEVG